MLSRPPSIDVNFKNTWRFLAKQFFLFLFKSKGISNYDYLVLTTFVLTLHYWTDSLPMSLSRGVMVPEFMKWNSRNSPPQRTITHFAKMNMLVDMTNNRWQTIVFKCCKVSRGPNTKTHVRFYATVNSSLFPP